MQVTTEEVSPGRFTRMAVEDAREHDQSRNRLEVEGERQQHRDGRDRPDPGQHANQRADQHAEKREAEIGGRERHPETGGEIGGEIHR